MAQLVEYDLAKVGVAGSSPVSRSIREADSENIGVRFFVWILFCLVDIWKICYIKDVKANI